MTSKRVGARWSRLLSTIAMATAAAGSMLFAMSTHATLAGAAAPSGTPIAIGDLCSCAGFQASSVAQTTPTAQAWASWINAHGAQNGKFTWSNGQKPACVPLMKPGTPEGGPLLKK